MPFIIRWGRLENKRKFLLLVLFLVGLGLSFQISNHLLKQQVEEVQQKFDRIADQHIQAIEQDFLLAFDLVYALAGFLEASDFVSKEEFEKFNARIGQLQPAAAAMLWIPRVKASEVEAWAEENGIELRQANADSDAKKNAKERGFYFPISLISGRDDFSSLRGLDQASNKATWNAMLEASRIQDIAFSETFTVAGKSQGFMALLPIDRSFDVSKTRGFVAGFFEYQKILEASIDKISSFKDSVEFEWTISDSVAPLQYPYKSVEKNEVSNKLAWLYLPIHEKEVHFKTANRVYKILYKPSAEFLQEAGTVLPYILFLILGCVFSSFCVFYVLLLSLKNREIELQVFEGTERLEESRKFLYHLVNSLPLGVFCKDKENDFRFTIWNKAMEEITGIPKEKVLGKTDFDIFSHAIAEKTRRIDQRVIESGSEFHASQESWERQTGEYRLLSTTKIPLKNLDGRSTILLGISVDISDQMEMKNALKDSKERFALAIRGAHDGIWEWSVSKEAVFCSERFKQILQLPVDLKVTPEALFKMILPADRTRFLRALLLHLRKREAFDMEVRIMLNENDFRWCQLAGQAVWDEHGEPTRMAGSLSDIHNRKITEQQLVRTSRLAGIGEMAASVAHEINNPATVLIGRLDEMKDYLKRKQFDAEVFLSKLNSSLEMTKRITKIVKSLRSSSRDGAHDPKLPCSLNSIIQESLALCIEKFRYNEIEVLVSEIPQDLHISCRSSEILQVFLNLLGNAFDSFGRSSEEKWIRISFEASENYVRLFFENNGEKIPAGNKDRIFEPFFTTKDVGAGIGLGLSISKNIVQDHDGKIFVETEPVTKFILHFPIVKVEEKAA